MNLTYAEIFELRGRSYHDAMLALPGARAAEFAALFDRNPVPGGARIFDIPAGGGYLHRALPPSVEVVGLELAADFGGALGIYRPELPWTYGSFDRGGCLAALHHIEDQAGFLESLARGLTPGGLLHIGDVPADSSIAEFLDGFVGAYNSTGHEGTYLDRSAMPIPESLEAVRVELVKVPWVFPSEDAMLRFCTKLFGLHDCPPPVLLDALQELVGIEPSGAGHALRWELIYADLRAAAAESG